MYHDFFGLNDAPFKITPNLNLFYSGGQRGAILEALLYAVTSGEGIIKVTGEVGSGKTMLCRMLEERLPENVETIFLANPSIARDQIQYAIGDELGLNLHDLRPAQVLRALQEHLIKKYGQGKHVVLFIDEAQSMPVETFEEIRLLSNLETGDRKLLQVVLFGQPELDVNLKSQKIRQLRERITHSFYLGSFDRKHVQEYLSFRLRAVGYRGPELFSPLTVRLITWASKGLLRRINILADKSMLAAFAENTHTIKSTHIKAAIRDSELYSFFPKWRIAMAIVVLLLASVSFYYFFQPARSSLTGSGSMKVNSMISVTDRRTPTNNDPVPAAATPTVLSDSAEKPKPSLTTALISPVPPVVLQIARPDQLRPAASPNSVVFPQPAIKSPADFVVGAPFSSDHPPESSSSNSVPDTVQNPGMEEPGSEKNNSAFSPLQEGRDSGNVAMDKNQLTNLE